MRAGWRWLSSSEGADLILVNSCGFIEPAQEESINATLDVLSAYPDVPVVMTGCLSQRWPHEIARQIPELAGVFGNRDVSRIFEIAESVSVPTEGANLSCWFLRVAPSFLPPRGNASCHAPEARF